MEERASLCAWWGCGGGGRESEQERKSLRMWERKRVREHLAPPFICFFSFPGPALCKLGLARSAVLPEVLTPFLGPSFDLLLFYFHGFSLLCLLATAILDSFSLF